jgi:hypothetical protein
MLCVCVCVCAMCNLCIDILSHSLIPHNHARTHALSYSLSLSFSLSLSLTQGGARQHVGYYADEEEGAVAYVHALKCHKQAV